MAGSGTQDYAGAALPEGTTAPEFSLHSAPGQTLRLERALFINGVINSGPPDADALLAALAERAGNVARSK